MLEMMKFIDYMYDPVNSLDGERQFMVFLKDGIWKILEDDELVCMSMDPEHIIDRLEYEEADLDELEAFLIYHIATEATLHMMKLDQCRELVGQPVIDDIYNGWKDMGRELEKAIRQAFNPLKLVETEDE